MMTQEMEKHLKVEQSLGYKSDETFVPKATPKPGMSKEYPFMNTPGVLAMDQTTSSMHSAIDKQSRREDTRLNKIAKEAQ